MRPDAEIVILGAGCAGLSLAAALADGDVPGRVLLLEPRTTYKRDRTWCFWNTEAHPFMPAVSHSWDSWRVSVGGRETVARSRTYRYCHIAGDDFYRFAVSRVDRAPDQELCRGVTVDSVSRDANGLVAVETNQGRLLARHVFDSRPPREAELLRPALLQRFIGWHVRAADARFDLETVELMRFLPSETPGRVRFLYLLPFSPTEALVEMTYLDDPSLPEPESEQDLKLWLAKHVGAYEVLYPEHGSLPMGTAMPPVAKVPGVLPIGIRGGRLKPSSGYGFLRMQRHSRVIAEALRAGCPAPAHAEPRWYGLMDTVFLRALQQEPSAAPELFLRMFAQTEPDALVRFLSEESRGVLEAGRVAWSLPKRPMLRAGLAALSGLRKSLPLSNGHRVHVRGSV